MDMFSGRVRCGGCNQFLIFHQMSESHRPVWSGEEFSIYLNMGSDKISTSQISYFQIITPRNVSILDLLTTYKHTS